MKLVTIEEHVLDPAVARASAPTFQQLSPYFGAAFDLASGLPNSPSADVLCDLDEGRIADMGMFTEPHLRFCVDVLGTDRMIYSGDYPFVGNDGDRAATARWRVSGA